MLENKFGKFHLRAYNEFFDNFIERWLENEEIPVVFWSYINLTKPNLSAKTFTETETTFNFLTTCSCFPQMGRFLPQMTLTTNGTAGHNLIKFKCHSVQLDARIIDWPAGVVTIFHLSSHPELQKNLLIPSSSPQDLANTSEKI
jgi:hypothetical protein